MCLPCVSQIFKKNQSQNFWTALCMPKNRCILTVLLENVNYSYHTDVLRYVALLHFIICTTPTTHTYHKTTKLSNLKPAFLKPSFHTNSMSHYLLPCYNGVINLQYYVTYRIQQH